MIVIGVVTIEMECTNDQFAGTMLTWKRRNVQNRLHIHQARMLQRIIMPASFGDVLPSKFIMFNSTD